MYLFSMMTDFKILQPENILGTIKCVAKTMNIIWGNDKIVEDDRKKEKIIITIKTEH